MSKRGCPLQFKCSKCGKNLKVNDRIAGEKGKCSACGETVTIPDAPIEASVSGADGPTVEVATQKGGILHALLSATNGLNKTAVAVALVIGVFSLGAYYLHLTNNRYYILTAEKGVAYEVDRRTGDTWRLYGTTKRLQEEYRTPPDLTLAVIPASSMSQVTGNASVSYGTFGGKLYNGSDWTVRECVFQVTVREADGSIRWSRRLRADVTIKPLSTSFFSVSVTGGKDIGSFTWNLTEARGYRASGNTH